jgi:hypothetical protein
MSEGEGEMRKKNKDGNKSEARVSNKQTHTQTQI